MTSRITAMFKTREAPALAQLGDKSGTKRALESARSHRSTEYGHRTRRGPGIYAPFRIPGSGAIRLFGIS
jgi:hypothetical protein